MTVDLNPSAQDTKRSEELFDLACEVMPGGVSSPVRAFAAVGGTPRFIARAAGPYIWDVDDNQYVDYVMSWGPLIHGHAYGPVVDSISSAARLGTSYGAPTENEIRLAELVRTAVPTVEMLRFVNSGTEATMSAIRLARGFTGRDLLVKFAGNYHGHADMLLAQAGSGVLATGVPNSPGVPAGTAATTVVLPYNDAAGLRAFFAERGDQVAAVIVEAFAGNMGVVSPEPGFLATIETLCHQSGALFICDEVITGFRVAFGGAQKVLDLHPDLTTFGKILGGGLPIGAYGGRRDVMERVAPTGPVYQAGTLSGNPLCTAAGYANLVPLLDANFYRTLDGRTRELAGGLREAADQAGVPVTVNVQTGLLTVFFTDEPVRNLTEAQRSDPRRWAIFFHAMLEKGFYLPPAQYEAWMTSSAHSDQIIEGTINAAKAAFQKAAQA